MSHLNPGLISAYNSLTDKHLAGYFCNTRIRRHLQRAGLITRSGRIVPDKEYRYKLIQRAHQRHIRECLAQAIFHKVLEMERLHQIEIKRELEEYARRERVHKLKVERTKRYEEDTVRIRSPRPPMGSRAVQKQYSGPEGEPSESSESTSSSRPNTAPGKMQRPVRLKPIYSNTTTMSLRHSSPYRQMKSSHGHDQSFNCTMEKHSRRGLKKTESSPHNGISPYCLPVINNFVTPVPPTTTRKERGVKVSRSTVRGRRLRPTTASSGADVTEDLPMLRSSIQQSKVFVNMVYFGKSVHLSHDLTDMRDDVKVFQQHCGGENLCVFKGKLSEGEMFQFTSRRHRGFPFSLTFFLNGLQVERLSSCCEFKHRKGSRLGGKHGHFGFTGVDGASPCYKCIIAMGLDKVPTPPSRTMKDTGGRHASRSSSKVRSEILAARNGGYTASHSECETSQPADMETQVEEETTCEEDKVKDEYEEDFEADEEGPAEEGEARGKNSPSPFTENEKQAEREKAPETEDDEKGARSSSSSSSLDSDREESDEQSNDKEKPPAEIISEESVTQTSHVDKPELAAATKSDSDMQDSIEDSTEIEITDSSLPTDREKRQSLFSSDEQDPKSIEQSKQEEERERAKSVQEKLVEVILKQSHCSSEPELSDTSTEESVDEGTKQNNKDAVPEKVMTSQQQQQPPVTEKTECEDIVRGHNEVSQNQEEVEEENTEKETEENNDSIKEEAIKTDEKTTADDATTKTDDTEQGTGEEDTKVQEEIPAEVQEEAPAELSDDGPLEKNVETEGQAVEEAEAGHHEPEQGADSKEGDESLISEANKEAGETVGPDNSMQEVVTAGETGEIEVNPSKEQEDLCHEGSGPSNTEERQQETEDAASEGDVNAGTSNSTAEESGHTAVEKTPDREEENPMDETSPDDKTEETEDVKVESKKGGSESEMCEGDKEEVNSVKSDEKDKTEIFEEEEEEKRRVNADQSEKDETENEDNTTVREERARTDGGEEIIENVTVEDKDPGENSTQEDGVTGGNLNEPGQAEEDTRNILMEESEGNRLSEAEKNTEENTSAQEEDKKSENTDRESQAGLSEVMNNKMDGDSKEEQENGTAEELEKGTAEELEKGTAEELEKGTAEESDPEKEQPLGLDANKSQNITDNSENSGEIESEKAIGETLENKSGSENIPPGSEKTCNDCEKVSIDAENGEGQAEVKAFEEDDESPVVDKLDVSDVKSGKEKGNQDDPEGHESIGGGDDAHEDSEAGVIEASVRAEEHPEQSRDISNPETATLDMKSDDGIESGRTENDGNDVKLRLTPENQESSLTEKNNNTKSSSSEVTESSVHREQSLQPLTANEGESLQQFNGEHMKSVGRSEDTKENVVSVEISAAEGWNEDTEDASKASEEGASVLLKPQQECADDEPQAGSAEKGPPEASADNSDLVTNWVNMHQSSKFFEKFVEPLEDLTESSELEPNEGGRVSDSEDKMHMLKNQSESSVKTTMEVMETELNSVGPKGEPSLNDCAKDPQQQEEENTEVQELGAKAADEQSDRESTKEPDMKDDKFKFTPVINDEQDKTAVESISSTHNSEAGGKSVSVSEAQPVKRTAEDDTDVTDKQTAAKELEDLPLATKTEAPDKSNLEVEENNPTQEMARDQSEDVLQIKPYTSKSDVGSLQESLGEEIQAEVLEESGKDSVQDFKRSLSREQLSTFSVDKSLFGHNSYSRLTAVRTESEH